MKLRLLHYQNSLQQPHFIVGIVIEKIKSIEELRNLNDFKEIINILIEKTNKLETELKDLNTNFDSRVRETVEKYLV